MSTERVVKSHSVTFAKRGMSSFEISIRNCQSKVAKEGEIKEGRVLLPCFMQMRRIDKDWSAATFLLVEEGSQAHILNEIGQIQKEKVPEEPHSGLPKEHYTQPNIDSIRSQLENGPEEDTNNFGVPKENLPIYQNTFESETLVENKKKIETEITSEDAAVDPALKGFVNNQVQKLEEVKISPELCENQIQSEIHQEPAVDQSQIQPEEQDQEKEDIQPRTPMKMNQELQQLASELRQKTRSQQKDARRQVRHDYIYNHNSVLLGERIEDIDFDETYFTRPSRLYKKTGNQDPSSRKKRQTGAGECCICYSRLF